MNVKDAGQILRRISEDAELLARMTTKGAVGAEVVNGDDMRFLRQMTVGIIADMETFDSYTATFGRMGKADKYVSTDRVQMKLTDLLQ